MGVTFRFIASPDEGRKVLSWFTELPHAPQVHSKPDGALLYFRQFATLTMTASNEVDVKSSPLVSVFLPHVKRNAFWTVGEVHFLANRIRSSFPGLERVVKSFREWLQKFPMVFRQPRLPETAGGSWDYYLEGGVRNYASDIFALPAGMTALERGQYFVGHSDSETRLDDILKLLRLRGMTNVEPHAEPNSRGGGQFPTAQPMMDSREKRAAEIQDSIRQILYHDWDPIGVSGLAPDDEYVSYIAAVYRILAGTRSEQELVEFLVRTERSTIGLSCESPEQVRPVARKLLALDVSL